jgi:hypothetical protein
MPAPSFNQTRPFGEDVVFRSSTTGEHNIDVYLEAAERGGKTLGELIVQAFDSSGNPVFATLEVTNAAIAAADSVATSAANAALVEKMNLGSKTSDPTADNQGQPLLTGALYYNSVASETRVYTGSSWKAAGSAVNGTANRYSYTATAAQTTFSAVYDVGFVDVYLNGIKLDAADFTATNGTSVVLASGAASGDVVNIIGYGAFEFANTYTVAATDALLAAKQDALVSGESIKTINGASVLGSGDVSIAGTPDFIIQAQGII